MVTAGGVAEAGVGGVGSVDGSLRLHRAFGFARRPVWHDMIREFAGLSL